MSKNPSQLRARDLVVLAGCGIAALLAHMLLAHPELSVFHRLVAIAGWLSGEGPKPDVVTWPAWGYAWVVVWVRSFDWIIVLQAVLGALALAALAYRLRTVLPSQGLLLAVLCIAAIPWHDMQVTLYPSGPAGSMALIALLLFEAALERGDWKIGALAGVLVGLAQNLRTEFVLMPAFFVVSVTALRHWRIVHYPSMRPAWTLLVTAFLMQVPWAIFYHAETGRYSLTESNFGHVMYVSLGSSPTNPWKAEGNDQSAMKAVHDAGYPFSSLSEPGNRVLRRIVWQKVTEHPTAVIGRTVQQALNTTAAPFNWGEPKLDAAGVVDIDVLRQELKARLGIGINVAKLNVFRAQNLYGHAQGDRAAKFALGYQIVAVACGSLIFLFGLFGMCLALLRRTPLRASLLLWLLACAALYKVLQDVLLAYQVNYLNNVYPMFLPFVAISTAWVRDRFAAWRSR